MHNVVDTWSTQATTKGGSSNGTYKNHFTHKQSTD